MARLRKLRKKGWFVVLHKKPKRAVTASKDEDYFSGKNVTEVYHKIKNSGSFHPIK